MEDLLFTIAIPTYNNESTIRKTISSCLNQETGVAYEVLVVNNASDDGTRDVIDSYEDEKIRVVTNKKTVSLFENHNVCLRNAIGKYIVFCHADDQLEGHAIKTLALKLERRLYPKKYVTWGHSMFRDYSANLIDKAGFSYNELIIGQYAPLAMLFGGLTPSGTCYSRESFLQAGGFLKVDKTAPSDFTTMIYLAMNGFGFEMMDEMIFWRDDASTAPKGGGEETRLYLQSLDEAFKYFIEKVDREARSELIQMSAKLESKPIPFYYAIAQDSYHTKELKRIVGGRGRIGRRLLRRRINGMHYALLERLYE